MLLNSHVKLYSAAYLFASLNWDFLFLLIFSISRALTTCTLLSIVVDVVCHFDNDDDDDDDDYYCCSYCWSKFGGRQNRGCRLPFSVRAAGHVTLNQV